MTDDLTTQFSALFQCAIFSCASGPAMHYFHEHRDLRMCIGDAVLDRVRKGMVKSGCVKNNLLFNKLKGAPNPTEINCATCSKEVGFDVWNLLFQCDKLFCKACIDAGRFAHRHPVRWCRIVMTGVA